MKVKVTQYFRPDGRQRTLELDVGDECKEKYEQITKSGCRLTCEQLMSGAVSQAIEHEHGDYDLILTKGADLTKNKEALVTMILRFDKVAYNVWLDKVLAEIA